jgi:hypothetical protein
VTRSMIMSLILRVCTRLWRDTHCLTPVPPRTRARPEGGGGGLACGLRKEAVDGAGSSARPATMLRVG